MTIKIWQSYSCNNSSSFRLVARFDDDGREGRDRHGVQANSVAASSEDSARP